MRGTHLMAHARAVTVDARYSEGRSFWSVSMYTLGTAAGCVLLCRTSVRRNGATSDVVLVPCSVCLVVALLKDPEKVGGGGISIRVLSSCKQAPKQDKTQTLETQASQCLTLRRCAGHWCDITRQPTV